MPNLKFLSYLVHPTDSFRINKGYIAKKSLKIAESRSNHQKSHLRIHNDYIFTQEYLIVTISFPRATTVANMYFFAVIKDYTPKPEVDFLI